MNLEPPPIPKALVALSPARKALMISAYVIAGFFAYMACLIAFIRLPSVPAKYVVIAVILGLSLVGLVVGLAASGFSRVARHVGLVLTAGGGVTTSVIIAFLGAMTNPAYRQMIDQRTIDAFSDYLPGVGLTVLLLLAGAVSLLLSRPQKT